MGGGGGDSVGGGGGEGEGGGGGEGRRTGLAAAGLGGGGWWAEGGGRAQGLSHTQVQVMGAEVQLVVGRTMWGAGAGAGAAAAATVPTTPRSAMAQTRKMWRRFMLELGGRRLVKWVCRFFSRDPALRGLRPPASLDAPVAVMTSLLATQLSRHPSLTAIEWTDMCRAHPARTSGSARFVPAVHRGPQGASIFLNPSSKYAYNNTMLPDGRTIKYYCSNNREITADLMSLAGTEVTLYAQVGRGQARQGRVQVTHPGGDVFHLRLVEHVAAAATAEPKKVLWADME